MVLEVSISVLQLFCTSLGSNRGSREVCLEDRKTGECVEQVQAVKPAGGTS